MKNAPVFAEIAGRLISLLAGRVIVAHNVGFELRFLAAELGRLGHTLPIGPNDVLCTLRLSRFFLPGGGRSIADCCDAYGIESENMHETLAEAIAVAKVFRAYLAQKVGVDIWSERSDRAASVVWPTIAESTVPWVSRSREQRYERRFLERAVAGMPALETSATADFREIDYLGMLDKALSDGFLSSHEADRLGTFAASLGIDNFARDILHRRYFMNLIASSWSDTTLTDSQRAEILSVAQDVEHSDPPDLARHPAEDRHPHRGRRRGRHPGHARTHPAERVDPDRVEHAASRLDRELTALTGRAWRAPRAYFVCACGRVLRVRASCCVRVLAVHPHRLRRVRVAHPCGGGYVRVAGVLSPAVRALLPPDGELGMRPCVRRTRAAGDTCVWRGLFLPPCARFSRRTASWCARFSRRTASWGCARACGAPARRGIRACGGGCFSRRVRASPAGRRAGVRASPAGRRTGVRARACGGGIRACGGGCCARHVRAPPAGRRGATASSRSQSAVRPGRAGTGRNVARSADRAWSRDQDSDIQLTTDQGSSPGIGSVN